MVASGKRKAERKNPNDPARFVGKMAATKDGEAAGIQYYLDEEKIAEEARYDGPLRRYSRFPAFFPGSGRQEARESRSGNVP